MNAIQALTANRRAPYYYTLGTVALVLVGCTVTISTLAQPHISTQPHNIAVQPGQDAQFLVVASGLAPLAYQWRFNNSPIERQTTNTLTVAKVELEQLGCYDVTVSNSSGTITSSPAWLLLATRWTELVFFGASDGRQMCATGPPWIDQLAARLGVLERNYSVAGASSTSVRTQIATYLGSYTPTTNVLFSFWVGGSEDAATGATERGASNRLDHVRALAVAGAKFFLIPRIPPLEFAPGFRALYPNFRNEMALEYDVLLDAGLAQLQAEFGLTVFRPDLFAWISAVWDNPRNYGFRDPPTSDFYCDGFHMTFAAHQLVSEECHRWMTPPLRITLIARSPQPSGDVLELQWQGGSPPFYVQYCEDLQPGLWQSSWSHYWTNVLWVPARKHEFFRVLYLGQ